MNAKSRLSKLYEPLLAGKLGEMAKMSIVAENLPQWFPEKCFEFHGSAFLELEMLPLISTGVASGEGNGQLLAGLGEGEGLMQFKCRSGLV